MRIFVFRHKLCSKCWQLEKCAHVSFVLNKCLLFSAFLLLFLRVSVQGSKQKAIRMRTETQLKCLSNCRPGAICFSRMSKYFVDLSASVENFV